MLDESMDVKPGKRLPATPRYAGQNVFNPRAQVMMALKNNAYMSQPMAQNPLAQALAKKKKKGA